MPAEISRMMWWFTLIGSVLATNGMQSISEPPSSTPTVAPSPFVINASNQFPDGGYACVIAPDVFAPDQCMPHCGDVTNHTVVCEGLFYPDGPNKDQPISMPGSGANDVRQLGKCQCDVPLLDEVYYTVALALPDIAAIGCELLIGTFETVLQAGLNAFPPTRALDAGAMAGLSAVDEISNKLSDDGQVSDSFMKWFDDPCPHSKFTDKMDDIFNDLIGIAGARGMRTGPGRPRTNPRDNPGEPPRDPPINHPSAPARPSDPSAPTNAPDNTNRPSQDAQPSASPTHDQPARTTNAPSAASTTRSEDSSSSAPGCRLHKRANRLQAHEFTSCGNDGAVNLMSVTSIVYDPQVTTITKTCDFEKWPQACYHYSSVQARSQKWEHLTCADYQGQRKADSWEPKKRVAAVAYSAQHKPAWLDAKWRVHNKACEPDEYPAFYWFTDSSDEIKNNEQMIRWLPSGQNQGAKSLWSQFCWTNALKPDNKKLDWDDVVKVIKDKSTPKRYKGDDKISTYETNVQIHATRPVFTMAFEYGSHKKASDLGLGDNTCRAVGLDDTDLGFVLRTDDPWYTDNKKKPAYDYSKDPPDNLLKAAKEPVHNMNVQRDLSDELLERMVNVTFTA